MMLILEGGLHGHLQSITTTGMLEKTAGTTGMLEKTAGMLRLAVHYNDRYGRNC